MVTAGIATAAGPSTSNEIAAAVYSAPDAAVAFAALPADQQAVFAARMANWTSQEVGSGPVVKRAPTAQERAKVGPAGLTAGCWSQYKYYKWYDAGSNTGDTWMTAHWCANASGITSSSLSGRGGQGYLGIRYVGLGGKYVRNVGWEVRQAQTFKFSIAWASANPCMQIRGGKTGLYSFRANCNLG
jgi:hypothetical protein